jgi:hypothetical protein
LVLRSNILLHALDVLMQLHQLIVQFLHAHLLVKADPSPNTLILPTRLPHPRLGVLEVHVTVLDEILPELPHTLRVLGLAPVTDDAGAPSGFQDLRLREHFGGVDVDLRLAVGVIASLSVGRGTLLFLVERACISREM